MIVGERRWRAAQKAGLREVPVLLKNVSDREALELALVENLQREDLRPIEEAEALLRMMNEYNYTQKRLALVIGKARSTITEALTLNKLPASIKDVCRVSDSYPRRLLVEVAKQKTPEAMTALFNKVRSGSLKRRGSRSPSAIMAPASSRSRSSISSASCSTARSSTA